MYDPQQPASLPAPSNPFAAPGSATPAPAGDGWGTASNVAGKAVGAANDAADLLTITGKAVPGPLDLLGKLTDGYNVVKGLWSLATTGVKETPAEQYGQSLVSGAKLASNAVPVVGPLLSYGLTAADLATKPAGGLAGMVGPPAKDIAVSAKESWDTSTLGTNLARAVDENEPALPAPPPIVEHMDSWPTAEAPAPGSGPLVSTSVAPLAADPLALDEESWASGYAE